MVYVNIPRDREDPNYRYKMPKLLSKIEGRGNGVRTNVYNMGEIARALKRPPMYPTKFFGCELGAMVKFEENEEKALINGAHNEQDLVAILDKFIQMYVLCGGCELPEIDISVKKGVLVCKCNACGYSGTLDNTHKAATYMARNPPNAADTTLGKKKKTKEERRAEKQALREEESSSSSSSSSSKADTAARKSKDKKKKKREEVDPDEEGAAPDKTLELSGDATPTNEGEESCEEEKASDAARAEKKQSKRDRSKSSSSSSSSSSAAAETKLMGKETLTLDSKEIADVASRLKAWMTECGEPVTPEKFFVEMRMLQVSQDFDATCRMYVVLTALFGEGLSPAALDAKMPFVAKCVDSSVGAPHLLRALEVFCTESEATAMDGFPYLLQRMYSAELLEAEDILNYYKADKGDASYETCKTYAEPFLKWLAEAESSDDEE